MDGGFSNGEGDYEKLGECEEREGGWECEFLDKAVRADGDLRRCSGQPGAGGGSRPLWVGLHWSG